MWVFNHQLSRGFSLLSHLVVVKGAALHLVTYTLQPGFLRQPPYAVEFDPTLSLLPQGPEGDGVLGMTTVMGPLYRFLCHEVGYRHMCMHVKCVVHCEIRSA